jgi:predicted ATPase/class 3 adenylate cyclase
LHDGVVRTDLPTGTVTFLFTDIEGSTRLLEELGGEAYAHALADHRTMLRDAFARHGGVEVDTQGDAFFYAFPEARGAVAAAVAAQAGLRQGPVRVRIGLHTGTPILTSEGYVGREVHRAARIAAAGHGGQVLASRETSSLLDESVELTDLGEHRLKDFAAPVWIYQLGTDRFPPLKTISNTNLPRPASSFVGREREVTEIAGLLRDGARLLTLTGPGGTGKTRLAIESAAEVVPEFKAGVFFVGLAALRDAELVSKTIGHTIGAKDGLADHVGEREMLLLLDNLEQVVSAAPELAELVEACPNLRILTTSRELLRVRGEVEYAVAPLADGDAIELFCTRSGLPKDNTIGELCRRLDNLPLAVELAAARTSVLSPAQILDRLAKRLDLLKGGRDADPRQQTLRATIEWSYDLLTSDEQRLLTQLAVFAGGWTLAVAEQVAMADLDTLQSLVDKSLVRHSEDRFSMLETIRQYAVERLEASGAADEVRRRHAEYFLALAEEAGPQVRGKDSREWLGRLEAEHDNLRAAVDEFEAMGETQLVLRLAGALWQFWYIRGHYTEGGRRLEAALLADERPTRARAKALSGATGMAQARGDVSSARRWAEEALRLNRLLDDPLGVAYATFLLGHTAQLVSDWATARRLFEESVLAFRELGHEYYLMLATDVLVLAYYKLGDRKRALDLAEENLRRARASGSKTMEMTALGGLGFYALDAGRVEEAVPLLVESIGIWRTTGGGDLDEIGLYVSSVARVAASKGQTDTAVRLISATRAVNDESGAVEPSYTADLNEGTLAIAHGALDDSAFAKAWEQGAKMTLDDAVALALTVVT